MFKRIGIDFQQYKGLSIQTYEVVGKNYLEVHYAYDVESKTAIDKACGYVAKIKFFGIKNPRLHDLILAEADALLKKLA